MDEGWAELKDCAQKKRAESPKYLRVKSYEKVELYAFLCFCISAGICPSVEAPGSLACDAPGRTNWTPTRTPKMPKAKKMPPHRETFIKKT